jgi:hypothetical protein
VIVPQNLEVCGCWVPPGCVSWTRHCYVGTTLQVPAASATAVAADGSERVSVFADHGRDAKSNIKFL